MSLALYSQLYSLAGRMVVVIGGASSMGTAIAEATARAGADLIIAGRSEARGHGCVEKVRSCGGVGGYAPVDLNNGASIDALIEYALGEYGAIHGLLQIASLNWRPSWLRSAVEPFRQVMRRQSQRGVVLNVAPQRGAETANLLGRPFDEERVDPASPPVHTLLTPPLEDGLASDELLQTVTAMCLTLLRHGQHLQSVEISITPPPRSSA